MPPVFVTILLIYFFQRMDCYGDSAFEHTKDMNWLDAFLDGLFGVWFANTGHQDVWLPPTWTLGIELRATFFIYLLAQTVRFYKSRQYIYGTLIWALLFIRVIDKLGVVDYYEG